MNYTFISVIFTTVENYGGLINETDNLTSI